MIIDQIFLEGIEISVCYSKTLYNLPIVPTLFREAAELIDSGNSFPTVFLKNSQSVIWFESSNDVIAFIVFDLKYDDNPMAFIYFSWVNPKFRGKGIRSMIQSYFEEICKKENVFIISSQTFVKNEEIDKAYDKIGLVPLVYLRFKKLK
jgi:GNAT superfamily N-acetyltransferase